MYSELSTAYPISKKYGKRLFDICFSLLVLILGAPIYLFLMALVKLTSKGPIFYKALRMGQGGCFIYCWKFRTMCLNAQEELDKLLQANLEMRKEWETFQKLKKDPRLTKVGAFLRHSSLDEIPQFWNVLKGDLSIVGPRPIDISSKQMGNQELHDKYGSRTDKILSIKPGITCIWQVQGRNTLTFQQRAALEELYVDTQSFLLDLKIILKTIYILIFPKGAY